MLLSDAQASLDSNSKACRPGRRSARPEALFWCAVSKSRPTLRRLWGAGSALPKCFVGAPLLRIGRLNKAARTADAIPLLVDRDHRRRLRSELDDPAGDLQRQALGTDRKDHTSLGLPARRACSRDWSVGNGNFTWSESAMRLQLARRPDRVQHFLCPSRGARPGVASRPALLSPRLRTPGRLSHPAAAQPAPTFRLAHQPLPPGSVAASPGEPQADLNLPGRRPAQHAPDLAEVAIAPGLVGRGERGYIREVDDVGAERQTEPLRELEQLLYSQVQAEEAPGPGPLVRPAVPRMPLPGA